MNHFAIPLKWTELCKSVLSLFSCSVVSNSATPWTAARRSSLSLGFPRQEYWSRLPFPSPGDLPSPGTESMSSALAGRFFTAEPPGKPISHQNNYLKKSFNLDTPVSSYYLFTIFRVRMQTLRSATVLITAVSQHPAQCPWHTMNTHQTCAE